MPKAPVSRDGWTYYTRHVRCNPRCAGCADGPGHGPYWYRQRREHGKQKTEYLGRRDPREGMDHESN